MKIKKKDFDVFNLSFLDIITCGFGAVILLVLIFHNDKDSLQFSAGQTENQLERVITLSGNTDNLVQQIDQQKKHNISQSAEREKIGSVIQTYLQSLKIKEREEERLADDLKGLSQVQSSLEKISIEPSTSNTIRDDEVGGIPVDSDHVIFVIDTSGSMQAIWDRVTQEIINILTIHPQVKGFQILDDQGKSILSGYSGKWIPDVPFRRKSVMKFFRKWQSASNSSPVEGIITALKQYKRQGQTIAIYVFGDDYTGDSYDKVIKQITKLNARQENGKFIAKIHAVGFPSQYTTDRFSILMRELARKNNGTFIALPIR